MVDHPLIIDFETETDALDVAAAIYNATRPTATKSPADAARHAFPAIRHPTTGRWALVAIAIDFAVHDSLRADPSLIVPDPVLGPLIADAAAMVTALAQRERIDTAFVLSHVKPAALLAPGDEGYSDWFPAEEI